LSLRGVRHGPPPAERSNLKRLEITRRRRAEIASPPSADRNDVHKSFSTALNPHLFTLISNYPAKGGGVIFAFQPPPLA
jgi:hypothetical protein